MKADGTADALGEMMRQAIAHHQAGRAREALELYRRVLSSNADHVDALHYGALAMQQLGQTQDAIAMLIHAIGLRPQNAALHNNLAEVLRASGQLERAMPHYQRAL
jgi:tetratricopeptide (TPR) repeat protein